MDKTPQIYTPWTDRLAMDVALLLEKSGETLNEVITRHGISALDIGRFNKDPLFLSKVRVLREEVREHGVTFRLKARAQAEELLLTSWSLIHDAAVSPAVKADLIKSTVKWGGLEPKSDDVNATATGGVTISINLGGQSHTAVLKDVTQEPVTIDQAG